MRMQDVSCRFDYTLLFVVRSLNRVRLFVTPWTAALQASLSFTISWSLLKFLSFESLMPSNHLILCHSLLILPSSIFPSIRLFTSAGQTIGASASVLPMNIQGWFPLVLTGLISLLFKGFSVFSSITVWRNQFFGTQPILLSSSQKYMITGETIALTKQIFVSKVMSLLFNMLSMLLRLPMLAT